MLRVLHEEEGRHKVPTGLLGRFITERGGDATAIVCDVTNSAQRESLIVETQERPGSAQRIVQCFDHV